MIIPDGEGTPLIRTDFSSDETWREIVEAATRMSPQGFSAHLLVVDDAAFAGADRHGLAELAERTTGHGLLILADRTTMTHPDRPLLCVDPLPPGGAFRAIAGQLWGIENNLALANMDFDEFASAVDPDGIFRGFRD
jgi:hypothetical protein